MVVGGRGRERFAIMRRSWIIWSVHPNTENPEEDVYNKFITSITSMT